MRRLRSCCETKLPYDAEQRIVRLVHISRAEMHIVGGDERQALGIREIDEFTFRRALFRQSMALQLDIEPIAEHCRELIE